MNVADKLLRDFDLLEFELADALAELAEPTEAKPFILNDGTPARLPPTNEPAEPETAASEADEVPEAELTHRQAQAAVEAAHTRSWQCACGRQDRATEARRRKRARSPLQFSRGKPAATLARHR